MNTSLVRWTKAPSTSAGKNPIVLDAMLRTRTHDTSFVLIVLRNLHSDSATTASPKIPEHMERTCSGPHVDFRAPLEQSSSEAILEIRRRSGLTWEQLSELFNVSRRSIHYWAKGRPLSSLHEKNMHHTLNAIRHLDNGNQVATRSRLLSMNYGESIFSLLANQKYEVVFRLVVGTASDIASQNRISLSSEEWSRRRPTRPELLIGALQDRPEISPNEARTVRPMRRYRSRE